MDGARLVFTKLGLKGDFLLGHRDPKHMLIRLQHEVDFKRIWLRELWFIEGVPMRVFRWEPNFRPDVESAKAPVWISLPCLPLFLFDKRCLYSIGQLIRSPLSLDASMVDLSHTSVARLCVKVDLLKKLPRRIWLECRDVIPAYWQDVMYERLSSYCKHCRRLGHELNACKFAHLDLAKAPENVGATSEKIFYKRKQTDAAATENVAKASENGDVILEDQPQSNTC